MWVVRLVICTWAFGMVADESTWIAHGCQLCLWSSTLTPEQSILKIGLKSSSFCKFQLGLDDYMIITGDNWLFHQAFKDSLFVVPLAALPIVGSSGAQLLRIDSSSWVAKVLGAMAGRSSQPVRESNADPQKRGFTIWLESLVYIFCPLDVYHTMYSDTAVTLISLKLISWFILGGVYQAGVPTKSLEIGIFPQQIVFPQQSSQFSTTCFFPGVDITE